MQKLPLFAATLLLAACAQTTSSPSPSPTPPSPDPTPTVTGTWIGSASGGQIGQFKFVFTQTGNYLKGEAYATASSSGTDFQALGPIDGALNGNALLFTINVNNVESYSVSGTVSGNTYSGMATYKPGTSDSQRVIFTVHRQ